MSVITNESDALPRPTVALSVASSTAPVWLDREAFPFQLRRLALPVGELSYVDEGAGEPILLVHGTPTWSFDFRRLIHALSKTHRVIAFDHLGFGLSARPRDVAYTPEAHAVNLRHAVEALGLSDFTLVVHDFGGPIALPLVFTPSTRVRRVVLLNTWMWSIEDDPAFSRAARIAGSWLGRWLYRYANASLRLITPSAYGDKRKLTPAVHRQYLAPFTDFDSRERVLWALARSLLGSGAHYAELWQQRALLSRLPVLIIWGMKDSAFPPHFLERWVNALPKAKVVRLPEAGHWPHEEAPAQVLAAIQDFLLV
jgi:haloalkane dehalogenase